MNYSIEYELEALADLVLGFLTSTQPTGASRLKCWVGIEVS
jgi:hypothetical protein